MKRPLGVGQTIKFSFPVSDNGGPTLELAGRKSLSKLNNYCYYDAFSRLVADEAVRVGGIAAEDGQRPLRRRLLVMGQAEVARPLAEVEELEDREALQAALAAQAAEDGKGIGHVRERRQHPGGGYVLVAAGDVDDDRLDLRADPVGSRN